MKWERTKGKSLLLSAFGLNYPNMAASPNPQETLRTSKISSRSVHWKYSIAWFCQAVLGLFPPMCLNESRKSRDV